MIEDETFDSIDDALDITDRGAEIMKKEPASKPVKKVKSGKEGKVLQVFPKKNQVLVEGINVNKKHQKPQAVTVENSLE